MELGRTFQRRRGIPRGRCTAHGHPHGHVGFMQKSSPEFIRKELIQSCKRTINSEIQKDRQTNNRIKNREENRNTMQILIHGLGVLPPSGRISFKLGDLCSYRRHDCFRSAKESKVESARIAIEGKKIKLCLKGLTRKSCLEA